jgi:hypothetical protein
MEKNSLIFGKERRLNPHFVFLTTCKIFVNKYELFFDADIKDISLGGMRVFSNFRLNEIPINSEVTFIAKDKFVFLLCEIYSMKELLDKNFSYGIKFKNLNEENKANLVDIIKNLEEC